MAIFDGTNAANTIVGGPGDDLIRGFKGDDDLRGGNGNDTIEGRGDNDVLNGGLGDDTVFGGNGDDEIRLSDGIDEIYGGNGTDLYVLPADVTTNATIFDYEAGERIDLSATSVLNSESEDFSIDIVGGSIVLTIGESTITLAGFTDKGVVNDGLIFGRQFGTEGADVFTGTRNSEEYKGLGGDDVINGKGGDDRLLGSTGDDVIFGGGGNDFINGGRDDDDLFGNNGDDTVLGWKGEDLLKGGLGNDELDGGDDNDVLEGGKGDNVLTGGTGADEFQFRQAGVTDTITDFEDGTDEIAVSLAGINSLADVTQADVGGDLVLTMGTTTVVLEGLAGTLLTSDDISF